MPRMAQVFEVKKENPAVEFHRIVELAEQLFDSLTKRLQPKKLV